ncbi:AAA family ATPase [Phytohabitans aurantiacus]|uniref:NACHT domain-containing protein n=1 Tax=Phytohabitans aurantiacus TaxID=3016789 RepID=A0ABQ5R837_9ACTN|nr:AAA family ATPase [Phytohabitans aurantiacus]GLI02934.1 hypothetical protein Pa4123_82120 [Phytohabitans aurantiacus]
MRFHRASGPRLLELQELICAGFNHNTLVELLLAVDKRYSDFVSVNRNHRAVVLDVLETANNEGWLLNLLYSAYQRVPDDRLVEHLRALEADVRDHLSVSVAYVRGGADSVVAQLRDRLAALPVTAQYWPGGPPSPDALAFGAIDTAAVVIVVVTPESLRDQVCRYALDLASPGSEVIALLAHPAVQESQLPVALRRIRIDRVGEGWADLERHLDFLATAEGLLVRLRRRREQLVRGDGEADAEGSGDQPEVRDVDRRIAVQRKRVEDPVGVRIGMTRGIERGRERERRPHREAEAAAPVRTYGRPPKEPPSFQDRETELEVAMIWLRTPAHRLLALTGRDGIGKTGFLSRLWNRLSSEKHPPRTDGLVYLPAHGFLPVTAIAVLRALVKVAPANLDGRLRRLLALPIPLLEKADEVLRALDNRAIVVMIDNAEHLLDDSGALRDREMHEFVLHVARQDGHGTRFVLVSQRPPEELLRELPEPIAIGTPLTGLDRNDTHLLLTALDTSRTFGFKYVSEEEKDRLHQRTGGNPRAVELVFAYLRRNPRRDLSWLLDEMHRSKDPDVVRFLFDKVVRDFDPDEVCVAQALAAYGRPVDAAAVDDLLQHFYAGTSEVILETLRDKCFIRPMDEGYYLPFFPDGEWFLQRLAPGEPEDRQSPWRQMSRMALLHLAAEHFAGAHVPDAAAEDVDQLYAQFSEIDLRIRGGDHEKALRAIEALDDAHLNRWGYREAIIPRLDALATGLADAGFDLRVRRLSRLAEAYRQRELPDRMIACLNEAQALIKPYSHPYYHVVINIQLGAGLFDQGRVSQASAHYRRALRWTRGQFGYARQRASAHSGLATCYGRNGQFSRALRHAHRAARLLRRAGGEDVDGVGPRLRLHTAWIFSQLGQHGPAWSELSAGLRIASNQKERILEGQLLVLRARLLIAEGGAEPAMTAAGAAAEIGVLANNGELCRSANEILTLACLIRGDLEQARAAVDVPGRSNGNVLGLSLRGVVAYQEDELAEARTAFETACEKAESLCRSEPHDFLLLDAYGFASAGLAIVQPERRDALLRAAEAAFTRSRALSSGGHGAVLAILQLLNQFTKHADTDVVDRLRIAASGAPYRARQYSAG